MSASLMTFADFEQQPYPDPGKMELVSGEVVVMRPPKKTHQDIAARIQQILFQRFHWMRVRMDRNGYRIGDNNWLEPDVSVTWPEQQVDESDYFRQAPIIAVEILSPGEEIDESWQSTSLTAHGNFWS